MFDWSKLTKDPNDPLVRQSIAKELVAKREIIPGDVTDFLVSKLTGKAVLDIGACSHDISYVQPGKWRHGLFKQCSVRLVGVDIIPGLASHLNTKGYDIRNVDATSDVHLGETFDVVVCGDVIEHVNDPVKLLLFCSRHLNQGGKIFVSTPNPFSFGWRRDIRKMGTFVANFEHISWIAPSNALEIGRRSNLQLERIYLFPSRAPRNPLRRIQWHTSPEEIRCSQFVFEFVTPRA